MPRPGPAACVRGESKSASRRRSRIDGAPEFLVAPAYAPAWKSDLCNGGLAPSAGGLRKQRAVDRQAGLSSASLWASPEAFPWEWC